MKSFLDKINKVFENRIRLAVMSILVVNDQVDFNSLKEQLQVTDGNLASHINTLEKHDYVLVNKEFVGKKPQTTYRVTDKGKKAFLDHLNALESLIQSVEEDS